MGLARQTVSDNVTINNLLLEPFKADRLNYAIQFAAESGDSCAFCVARRWDTSLGSIF